MRFPKGLTCQAVLLGFFVAAAPVASADTVGYWRMEADDNAAGGYSIANEISGGSALTGASGSVSSLTVPADPVPLTGVANTGALDGGVDVNGTISSYEALNSESITVEFWVKTSEGTAGLFTRSTGSDGTETAGTDGITMVAPNSLGVTYFVDNGDDTSTQYSVGTIDTNGTWQHIAFTYEKSTGVGSFYRDGHEVDAFDGDDNLALYWGDGLTDISIGQACDGGAGSTGGIFDELRISNTALSAASFLNAEQFTGIAKDSFLTTTSGTAGTYVHEGPLYNSTNTSNIAVTEGTVGFSVDKVWGGSSTSNISLRSDAPDDGGLTHNLLSGELEGAARLKVKDPRVLERQLDATIPESSVYYMSALLHATKTEEGNVTSVGFSGADDNRNTGFHIGFNGDNIALFAGGNAYDLLPGAYQEDITYLVLAELLVDASGNETLNAYFSLDGESGFHVGLTDLSVETFSSVADLGYLQFIINGNGVSDVHEWWIDEVRLATTIADLGVDFSVVPEPSTLVLALFGLLGLAFYGRRRRR